MKKILLVALVTVLVSGLILGSCAIPGLGYQFLHPVAIWIARPIDNAVTQGRKTRPGLAC